MAQFAELNMDAFSDGQMSSKLWLCEKLEDVFRSQPSIKETWIYGSWYGLLALLLLTRKRIQFQNIHLFDVDEKALTISKKILDHWRFQSEIKIQFHLHDCNQYPGFLPGPELVINTSVEHFQDFSWWHSIPSSTWYALQATNMVHPEHINCISSIHELKEEAGLTREPAFQDCREFNYPKFNFKRFMLIGQK